MKNIFIFIAGLLIVIIGIPSILIQGCDPSKEDIPKEILPSGKNVKVYIQQSKKIETIDLEEYIIGVVAGEMPATFEMEALKAQAVAARSYAVSRMRSYSPGGHPDHPGAELCNDVHCQVWLSKDQLLKLKSKEWIKNNYPKIQRAVHETRNMIMTYGGNPVDQPLFHSTSGGKTENSEDVFAASVPYLRSVESPFEEEAPHLTDKATIPISTFVSKMRGKYKDIKISPLNIGSSIKILERSSGGRVLKIKVGNIEVRGRDIRDILGLRSANFTLSIKGKNIEFTTIGYGHGVGMSQWGANGMAKKGYTFDKILKHYYLGVEIAKIE